MRLLRQFYVVLLLIFSCTNTSLLYAQHIIEGQITNSSHIPVPFANIVLQNNADSRILQSELSDSNGMYRLSRTPVTGLVLRVNALGYKEAWRTLPNDSSYHLDIVLTSDSKSLSGITVSARKPLIERRIDRTVFNVENSIATIGGDALEALKRSPGVRVSDNNISIAGKSTVSVMINDKLLQVSGEELANVLKSIPADNLSRIEIITTPPAKYDAAGNAGLINIVTKKLLKNGLNGNLTASYMQRTSRAGSINGNFNYRHNKLNVFGFTNIYRANPMPDLSITTQYADQRWEQRSNVSNHNVFNRSQLGVDYNIAPNMIVGALYTLGNGGDQYYGDVTINSKGYNLQTGHIDSIITTRALTNDRGVRNVANLNYMWKIDSMGRRVNIDLDYFTRTGRSNRDLKTDNFFESGYPTGFSAITRTSGKQTIDIRSGKIDVEWPTTFASFTFGGKASFIHNTSDNLFEYLQSGAYLTDTGKTNNFDYRENTQALYISGQKSVGKWEAQIGLRGEYTQTESYSATINQKAKNEYLKLFPTIYLQYKFNENDAININYSKRIDRPDFFDMNPFRMYFTATSYSQGNPFLQPSFSNNIELGYILKSKYNFTVYANLVDNVQTRVSYTDTANKSYSFNMANVGKAKNYGASFSVNLSPAKWWECMLSGNAWYGVFSSSYYNGTGNAYSRPAFTLETNNTFNLNKSKTLVASVNFTYNSTNLDDFDVTNANYIFQAGIRALLFNKKITVALNGFDIFRSEKYRTENLYNGTLQDNYYDERTIRLSVTWKFGSNDIKAKRERNAGSDDENRAR